MTRYQRDVEGSPRHEPPRVAAQPARPVRQEGHAVHGETRAPIDRDGVQVRPKGEREHGNFDVPAPTNSLKDGDDEDGEGKCKFYKWVTRLHNECRGERY